MTPMIIRLLGALICCLPAQAQAQAQAQTQAQAQAQAGSPEMFQASVHALTPDDRDKMTGRSWHAGCPVPLDDLVSIHLNHIGYDGAVHDGVVVIHRRLADEVVEMFRALFSARFQIERMQPYEDFPVGAYAASNDTAGFYCRPAQDNPTVFSWHAYGLAIDINPLTNPYKDPKEGWWPKGSSDNSDRNRAAPGLLSAHSEAVELFLHHGWAWGGLYGSAPDYMHFGKVTLGEGSNPLDRPVWATRLEDAPK